MYRLEYPPDNSSCIYAYIAYSAGVALVAVLLLARGDDPVLLVAVLVATLVQCHLGPGVVPVAGTVALQSHSRALWGVR